MTKVKVIKIEMDLYFVIWNNVFRRIASGIISYWTEMKATPDQTNAQICVAVW